MLRSGIALFLITGMMISVNGCSQENSASDDQSTYKPRVKPTEVEVATTRYQPIQTEIKFTGSLLPRRMTRVGSDVEGVVAEIPQIGAKVDVVVDGKHYSEQLGILYGQEIGRGELLVRLDTREEEVALRIAEAKLQKAKADLTNLKAWERPEEINRLNALREEAIARLEQSKQNFQRMEQLHQRKAISSSEFEKAVTEVSTAKATVAAADAVLAKAQAGPTHEEIEIQKALVAQAAAEVEQCRLVIDKAQIKAPYDGVVTAFHVEVGDRVSPNGDPVAEIMDLRFLIAEIAVPEAYISNVHLQDRATVQVAGVQKPVTGLVVAVNDMVDPQTRTFSVRIAIDNESRKYKAGQFANVHLIFGDEKSERLAIPSRAIVLIEGTPHVFRVNGNQVESTPIELGLANDSMTEVVQGLSTGDLIVVDDPNLLADEMMISIKNSVADVASR